MSAALLYGVCVLSGCAALIFEHIFFRRAGLFFGSSVWATSVVLAAFMAGLALGSLVAARAADRVRNPLRAYAAAEAVVAVAGSLVVLAMPAIGAWLAPRLGLFVEQPFAINALRFLAAFGLMCVPTTAMGVTLPFLVRGAQGLDPRFGVVLGRLYGANTLGAMLGALAGETALYGRFGVGGTALVAAAGSLTAAALAGVLARRVAVPAAAAITMPMPARGRWRLLMFAAGTGAVLLALEVVWTRFLQLFLAGTHLMFAVLLAVVLAGIGLGGVIAAALLARWPDAHRWVGAGALAAGFIVAGSYAWLRPLPAAVATLANPDHATAALTAGFALPVSIVSGVLFALTGAALQAQTGRSGWSTGLLASANTFGAMAGALAGGFVLLPRLGVERSFLAAAVAYGLLALLAPGAAWRRPALWGVAGLWLMTVALFPHGLMARAYLARPLRQHLYDGGRVAAWREGLTETIVYIEASVEGIPYEHRLITNGYNMSASSVQGRRYMKLYVYLPAALHPRLENALLISYGVGSTAKALTDTRELRRIDVVDISRDILELSSVVFPDPRSQPLRDPRVRVHVEDGRYFLHATKERYDLITAEPPPPKIAGVVNLYSREFFALVHSRLKPGGFATYWLPLHSLEPDDARAITAAFCAAFPDCSLWKGMGLSWMLVGTRDARGAVDAERFAAQWSDAGVAGELRSLGFERPEQLGALFIADAEQLAPFLGQVPPLEDDHPHRLRPSRPVALERWYVPLARVEETERRFSESGWIREHWPSPWRAASVPYFEWQGMYDRMALWDRGNDLADLHRVLTGSNLDTLPLQLLHSSPDVQRIASRLEQRGVMTPFVMRERAHGALARRQYAEAARRYAEAARHDPASALIRLRLAYALMRAGRPKEARAAMPAAFEPGAELGFLASRSDR